MNGSLANVANFVTDFKSRVSSVPFVPENLELGRFTFLPWVRSGLASAVQSAQGAALRADVKVTLSVEDVDGGREQVEKTVTLRGPGDLIGIDSTQIIRRCPAPGAVDAEENFLAHVEFDRPEFPWLFTPLAPQNDRLQPWLVLVVCDLSATELMAGPPGMPRQLKTVHGQLPDLADAWAFAHAQVVGSPDGNLSGTLSDRLSDAYSAVNLSRLICPRKLEPRRSYLACLVPSFDCGVQAGRGLRGGTLGPAWQRAADGSDAGTQIVLPVYDSWQFSTAPAGDFEELARRLVGIRAPWSVGRRLVDASKPGRDIGELSPDAPGAKQTLRCALVSPNTPPPEVPADGVTWDAATRQKLQDVVIGVDTDPQADLPRVRPRLYAQFQRGTATIDTAVADPATDADWFPQLNTTPMHRAVAGLGTRVVQRDQEPLMQAAWAQVGEIDRANRALSRMQFARYIGEALHKQHLSKLSLGDLVQVTRGVQAKVAQPGTPLTVYGNIGQSFVAASGLSSAFRRITAVRGALAQRLATDQRSALGSLVAKGGQFQDFRRAYVEPDGVRTLSPAAIQTLSPSNIAQKLGVAENTAVSALTAKLATPRTSVTDRVLAPLGTWHIPAGTIDIGTIAATKITEHVSNAAPANIDTDPARSDALAAILVGVKNSDVPSVSGIAGTLVEHWGAREVFSPPVRNVGVSVSGMIAPVAAPAPNLPIDALRATGRLTRAPALMRVERAVQPAPAAAVVPIAALRFETNVSRQLTDVITTARAVPALDLAKAISNVALGSGALELPKTPVRSAPAVTQESLLRVIAPATTVSRYARGRLGELPNWLPPDWFDDGRLEPIMAAPHFDRPMYEALDDYNRDWLVPGLGEIAESDFVTVLETNPQFTESFLLGLSDEFGRELLWRGYPTDARGTYFRRFWNAFADELSGPINRFNRTPLGTHVLGENDAGGHLVMVVRGEIVRRHPDALLFALRAKQDAGKPEFIDPDSDPRAKAEILFHIHLDPNILLVGFKLTKLQVQLEPWWFLISEHPTAPRFGLDLAVSGNVRAAGPTIERNDLDWNDLTGPDSALNLGRYLSPRARTAQVHDAAGTPPTVEWSATAATVATTLLQSPIRAAFHGKRLLEPALG